MIAFIIGLILGLLIGGFVIYKIGARAQVDLKAGVASLSSTSKTLEADIQALKAKL